MAYLSLPCPHCRSEKIGFVFRHALPTKKQDAVAIFMQCEGCTEPIIVTVNATWQAVNYWANQNAYNQVSERNVIKIEPALLALTAPSDVPPNVARAFVSGMDNLRRRDGSNAAAMMFRRSIEVAAKFIDGNKPVPNLKARIESLPPEIVTPAMKAWAHHVRLDANEATHEPEEFSEEDAERLHVFAEMFLTYAFTLPAMLTRAVGEKTPA